MRIGNAGKELMKKNKMTYKQKAFTIAELLVVLALTSVSVTLSYGTLNYVQKLFTEYKKQNRFLNEYTELKQRMDYEALKADYITEEAENHFMIRRDSTSIELEIQEAVILLRRKGSCDTFHLISKNIRKEYETMNSAVDMRLLSKLKFETYFSRQRFNFCFEKHVDAAWKLKLEQQTDGRY